MLKQLKLHNFRNFSDEKIDFSLNSWNVFHGENGSGKTNLLESIFFVGILRSFKTAKLKELIKNKENSFYLNCLMHIREYSEVFTLEYFRSGKKLLTKDNTTVNKSSDFIRNFYPVAFIPEDIMLISGNSALRRRFFDMLISILDNKYFQSLHAYNLAMRERNYLLKKVKFDLNLLKSFEYIMAESGCYIWNKRQEYKNILSEQINKLIVKNKLSATFDIVYDSDANFSQLENYLLKFEKDRDKDIKKTFSSFGIHLDDFILFFQDKEMRNFASNGQSRLMALYLKMAAVNILYDYKKNHNLKLAVLVDDVTGDLDNKNKSNFFEIISQADQGFFTFTAPVQEFDFKNAQNYNIKNGKIFY